MNFRSGRIGAFSRNGSDRRVTHWHLVVTLKINKTLRLGLFEITEITDDTMCPYYVGPDVRHNRSVVTHAKICQNTEHAEDFWRG